MTALGKYIIASLCLIACGQPTTPSSEEQDESSHDSINPSDTIRGILGDVHPIDSLNVLRYLETLRASSPKNKGRRLLAYAQADSNWVRRTDIPGLLDQIGSNERAFCVMSVHSSLWVTKDEFATIGGHAMDIIDAYRFRTPYPPLKACPKTDSTRVADIRTWWNAGGQPNKNKTGL